MVRNPLTSGNAPGEAIVRAALAEYRRCLSAYRPGGLTGLVRVVDPEDRKAARAAMVNAEEILAAAAHQVHGFSVRASLPRPSAVEVDGALVVIDPLDPGDEGNRVHVVELAEVVRFDSPEARPGREEAPDA